MAARLRAPRLLFMLTLLTAVSTLAIAPAASAQEEQPTTCTEEWVHTDLHSDGAYEWSFNGEVYDQTRYRTLDLKRDVPFTLSVAGDLGNGRTFEGWNGDNITFSDRSAATVTVTVHGSGSCFASISANYSDPVETPTDWSWLWSWWPW